MSQAPSRIFQRYFETGHAVFTTLVEHPNVANPSDFALCSISNQRATILHADGRQSLTFRSFFHSTNREGLEPQNFVPKLGVQLDFPSEKIWFPLALTEVIDHEFANVELDIVTKDRLREGALPKRCRIVRQGSLKLRGRNVPRGLKGRKFSASRVRMKLAKGQPIEDLEIEVPC